MSRARCVDRHLGDLFGFGARDKDPRTDRQFEVSERRAPGEVLEWLARRAAGHQRVEPGQRGNSRAVARAAPLSTATKDLAHARAHNCRGDDRLALEPARVGEEDFCVDARGRDPGRGQASGPLAHECVNALCRGA